MPVMPAWIKTLSWQTGVLALVCGGIIHIVATLIVPQLAIGSGVARLTAQLAVNRVRVMPVATTEVQPLPFIGPDVRLAICRYDVSNGPVSVSAVLPDKGWSLGFYTMSGDNFFVVPAPELRAAEVNFQLIPQTERFLGIFNLGRGVEASASQITVPQSEGLIVLRAPLRGRAYQSETEAILQRARCGTIRVG